MVAVTDHGWIALSDHPYHPYGPYDDSTALVDTAAPGSAQGRCDTTYQRASTRHGAHAKRSANDGAGDLR